MNKLIIALFLGSAQAYPIPRPIAFLLDEYDINTQEAPHMLTDSWVDEMSRHRDYVNKNPNEYFGQQNEGDTFFNNRYGDLPDGLMTHHDDEPIIMGQATISSGSDSSDSDTEEDKAAHLGALEEANRLSQDDRFSRNPQHERRFDDQQLQLRFVDPSEKFSDDDYAEQIAVLRDTGDKDLTTFKTRKEMAEAKK